MMTPARSCASELDEICREGAGGCWPPRSRPRSTPNRRRSPTSATRTATGWWSATARPEPRVIATGAGPIEVEAPTGERQAGRRATGERCRFTQLDHAPWCRKSPKVSEVLPLMYLHGMSSGDFAPALGEFFGSDAGLSPSVITRLTTSGRRSSGPSPIASLADVDYVYCGPTACTSTSGSTRSGCAVW